MSAVSLVALLAAPTVGCGTILSRIDHNPDWDLALYSGGALDAGFVFGVGADIGIDSDDDASLLFWVLFTWPVMIDLPFSLVADTLMLPWTIPEQFSERRKELKRFVRAVEKGNLAGAKSLAEKEPELLRCKAENNGTPLHHAVNKGQLELVEWLANETANDNAEDYVGQTPLSLALWTDRADLAKILLDRGADPNHRAGEWMPLHWAAAREDPALSELLLDLGMDLETRTKRQETALHLAADRDRTSVVALLLAHGADVNARGPGGATPLHLAARKGHLTVAQLLVDNGADVRARTDESAGGRTPLEDATRGKHLELADFLRSRGVVEHSASN